MTAETDDPVVAALQAALAGEHAAVYAYTVVGGRLDGDSPIVALALECHAAHRTVRDALVAAVRARAESPVPTEPGYALPFPVEGASSARALARLVEDRCAVLHATVVATASGEERRFSAEALVGCATRGLRWGAPATAFPGVGRT
jgi:hypothetical protein